MLDFLNQTEWRWEGLGILAMADIPASHGSMCGRCSEPVCVLAGLVFTRNEDDVLAEVGVMAMGYTEIRYINQPCGHVTDHFEIRELLTSARSAGDAVVPPGEEDPCR